MMSYKPVKIRKRPVSMAQRIQFGRTATSALPSKTGVQRRRMRPDERQYVLEQIRYLKSNIPYAASAADRKRIENEIKQLQMSLRYSDPYYEYSGAR